MAKNRVTLPREKPPAGRVQLAFGYRDACSNRCELSGPVEKAAAAQALNILVESARRISRGEVA